MDLAEKQRKIAEINRKIGSEIQWCGHVARNT